MHTIFYAYRDRQPRCLMGRAVLFGAGFTALELATFFVLVSGQVVVVRDLPVSEAIAAGGYAAFWRVISLQVFLQAILVSGLSFLQKEGSLVLLVLSGALAFLLAATFYLGAIGPAVRLFAVSEVHRMLNDGQLLIVALALAWLVVNKGLPALSRRDG